jgi:hypothetical protein
MANVNITVTKKYDWGSKTYHAILHADGSLTITNGGEYDWKDEVRLTPEDQVALLHILAEQCGVDVT